MLLSIALILVSGLGLGWLCKKAGLPGLIGMLLAGIVLGPYALGFIGTQILDISSEIRKIALIIILTRAGLGLDLSGLKKIGRPALLMCFVPASLELVGMLLIGPWLLGISLLEAAVVGSVLAAVSPAVVVPRMIRLMEEGYGKKQAIPELILAGASVDDVYVIVLFTTFVGMAQGEGVSVIRFVNIPVSIVLGIGIGLICGYILSKLFEFIEIRDTAKALIVLSGSFALCALEDALTTSITFSALISIMFIGIALKRNKPQFAASLSAKYNQLWVCAEVFLFVLVGAAVNIEYLGKVGVRALVVIIGALVFRMLGVFLCVVGTKFNRKERLFTMIAYTPKATVQAAIGAVPLGLGLKCGDVTLTIAVLAIVLTAPLGAFAIDRTYKKLLTKE